jgi:glycopeptide antibiotics resistance protein
MTSVSIRLLVLWTLFVVLGTLAPFDFRAIPVLHRSSFGLFRYGTYERDPVHFALNLVLFVPLGALLHHEGRRRQLSTRSILLSTGAIGLLFSLTVEYLQGYLPSRDSSLFDVLANTSGGLMGILVDGAWGASAETRVDRMRARTSGAILAAAIAVFMLVALLASGALQARTGLSNWSREYPLLIGNERTGDRPWRGRVFALAITDAATPLALVRRFAAGESVALPGSPLVTFDFTGDPPYRDKAGNVPDVDWTERASESASTEAAAPHGLERSGPGGAITLTGRPWLQTGGPAVRIAQSLRKTNTFTLRIRCATDNTNQDGPARIVSNSFSTLLRNFTVGQQGADLVFRLRTPQTGDNGYPLETIVAGAFASKQPRDIIVTYDGATLLGGIADTDRIFRTELTPAVSLAGLVSSFTSQTARTDELPMYKMIYFSMLFLPPGVLIGLLGSTRRRRVVFGSLYAVTASVLLEVTLVLASGRSFAWGNVLVVAAVGALVLVACFAILARPDRRHPGEGRSWIATESSV